MNAIVIGNRRFHIDWTEVCKWTKELGKLAFAFALGGWLVSIRAQEGQLPYRTEATHQLEQVKKVAGPNPVATIACERNRANVAEAVADQSVAVSNFAAVQPGILKAIPDCPPAPKPSAKPH